VADESISVKIDGDARGFIKASAEVAKAAEKMADTAQAAMGDAAKAANNLEVEIKQIGDEAGKAVPKVEALNKSQANLANNTNSASVSFKSLQQASTAAFAALLANPLAQVATAIGLITRAIGEASESEREAAAIFAAFGTDTAGLEKTSRLVKELADSTGLFDEGNIAAGAAALKELGATQGQIEALLPAATNLAAVYGTTIPDAVKRLAGGIVGSTEGLRNFGINVKNNSTTTERYAAILERNARATEETKRLSEGLTGAMARLGIATNEAFGSFGENFSPALTLAIDGITKLLQAIALVPPAVMLAAESIVNLSGNIGIAMGSIGEKLENFFSGKGFKSPKTDMFWNAWRKQGDETFGKTFKDFQARLSALLGGPTGAAVGTNGIPDVSSGLIKPPGEESSPDAKKSKTLLERAQELARTMMLYGKTQAEAQAAAGEEILKGINAWGLNAKPGQPVFAIGSAAGALKRQQEAGFPGVDTSKISMNDIMSVFGFTSGGQQASRQNLITERLSKLETLPSDFANISDKLAIVADAIRLAELNVRTALPGDEEESARKNLRDLKNQQTNLLKTQSDINGQFITKFADVLSSFLGQFASTIGASFAGGQGATGGDKARGFAGLLQGGLGIAGMAAGQATMMLGSITVPVVAVIAAVGSAIGVLGNILGGFFDQTDQNLEIAKEQLQVARDSQTRLAQIQANTGKSITEAGLSAGFITESQAAIESLFSGLRSVAASNMGTLGVTGQKFGTVGQIQNKITDYLQSNPDELKRIVEPFVKAGGSDKALMALTYALRDLPGEVGDGFFGLLPEQRNSFIDELVKVFGGLSGMKKTEEERKFDAEMAAIGSTPRNPVYIYDVTPKEEQFTFAPREAFFRAASMRQLGYNDVNLSAARA